MRTATKKKNLLVVIVFEEDAAVREWWMVAYWAKLDTDSDNIQMLASKTIEQPTHNSGNRITDAQYDWLGHEIVLSRRLRIDDNGQFRPNAVWCLGRYFEVSSIEHTSLPTVASRTEPALFLDDGAVTVCTALSATNSQGATSYPILISRKDEDGKWTNVPLRCADGPARGSDARFVAHPLGSRLGYVHLMVDCTGAGSPLCRVQLYTMRRSRFVDLVSDKHLAWHRYSVELPFETDAGIRTLVTQDTTTKDPADNGYRLHFFSVAQDPPSIVFSHIPLRPDGSVRSSVNKIEAREKHAIQLPNRPKDRSHRLALEGGKAFVFFDASGQLMACTAKVNADGSLPEGKDWKVMAVRLNGSSKSTYSHLADAIIVREDFVGE